MLSYVVALPIERSGSSLNPLLEVRLSKGRYRLETRHAIYSFDDLYSNFSNAFDRLDVRTLRPAKVLVLGLGLGSVPFMLEARFGLSCSFVAVELDAEVVRLARKYTLAGFRSPIRFVCADAGAFVQTCEERFDLVAMDIFVDDEVPPALETRDFLARLKGLLAPGGTLLYNRLSLTAADKEKSHAFFEERFKAVFANAQCWDVGGGNWMLFGQHAELVTLHER
jgi:hypothetical protein